MRRKLSRRQQKKKKNTKKWVAFRATSFNQSQSPNEMLTSFSFSFHASCASFSSSSWTFPVKIIICGLFSQIKCQHWTKSHKREITPTVAFSPSSLLLLFFLASPYRSKNVQIWPQKREVEANMFWNGKGKVLIWLQVLKKPLAHPSI